MTIETWVAFCAAAIFVITLPSPLSNLIARFSLQKSRGTAVATVPGACIGLAAALTIAALPVAAIAFLLPGMLEPLSWAGIAYLMFYILWTFQDPALRIATADNDNLPEQEALPIFTHLLAASLRTPRYAVMLAALLVQFIDPQTLTLPLLLEMQAVFLLTVAAGSTIHVVFPQWTLNRLRRNGSAGPAPHRAGTRFISRRAVSAGYRRIAA